MSKVTKVSELSEDKLREREESRQRKQEENKRKDEEFKDTQKRKQENAKNAEEAIKKAAKKKNTNYSYHIMFGLLGALVIYVIVMTFMNQAAPLHKVLVIDSNKILEHNDNFDWKQGPNSFFEGATLADAKTLFNAGFSNHNNLAKCYIDDSITPPESFHVKEQWPNCILPIASTGKDCGSSYAFALASALSERICITKGGSQPTPLSAQELLTCDVVNNGCKGGYLNNSLDYLKTKGITTETCYAYKPEQTKCEGICENPTRTKIDSYCLLMEEDNIKRDILRNGPVISTMQIYVDFLTYKSGIYKKADEIARFSGQHAIKIVGWGVETEGQNTGIKYWIIQNNWGTDWGIDGYAKVEMGQDLFFDHYAYGLKIKADSKPIQTGKIQEETPEETVNLDLDDIETK